MEFIKFIDKDKYFDESGVYEIVNTKNNKRYVGQTTMPFKKRYWHHNWKLFYNEHDNIFLQEDYNSENYSAFEFRVLFVNNDKDLLDKKEKEYISFYREENLCYNILDGGRCFDLRKTKNEETYKIIGEKNRQHMTGKKLSEKIKLKMAVSHQGEKAPSAKLKTNDVLEIMTLFEKGMSNTEIAKIYNVTSNNIRMIRKGISWNSVTHYK